MNKTNLSDHNIITVTTNLPTNTHLRLSSEVEQAPNFNFNQLNFLSESVCWDSIKKDLGELNWDLLMRDCDPEAQYDTIINTCLKISMYH